MRRIATLLVGLLLACSIAHAQERLPSPSQLPGDKKPLPDKKPPIAAKEPLPELAREATTPTGRTDIAERRVARVPEMLGDVAPAGQFIFVPPAPTVVVRTVGPPAPAGAPVPLGVIPGVRYLKVADNGSPRPQDRVYLGFNFYENLYDDANRAQGSELREIRLYRTTLGFEKTLFDRRVSFGMRIPMNTLAVQSSAPATGGSHTAIGDLALIMQAALLRDEEAGDYLSLGMGMTLPTGPNTLGNIAVIPQSHTVTWQPFLGFLVNAGNAFVQGFTAVDFPSGNDVALWYTDIGLGMFVLRAEERQFITAIAPALEVHSSVGLNKGPSPTSTATTGYANVVSTGLVLNMEFYGRSRFAIGGVYPISSPQPFDVELIAQFRFIF